MAALVVVPLKPFLQEAGLGGYEYALREAGMETANDILDVEAPMELLELSCLEQQALIRSLVELRRTIRPPLPLPPGKRYHFYVVHSDAHLAEPLTRSLEREGATVFTNHVVTYRRSEGSISRWHVPKPGFSPIGANRTAERMGHGSYQHSYSGGGGCSGGGGADTSLSLSPSVTQQLSMHRDLSETLQSFHGTIAEAHPSHRTALGAGRGAATAGLDETTERGAEACMRATRHVVFVLGEGTLAKEYVLQELRWAKQHEVRVIGLYDPTVNVDKALKSLPPDLKKFVSGLDYRPLQVAVYEAAATTPARAEPEGEKCEDGLEAGSPPAAVEREESPFALEVNVGSPRRSREEPFTPGGQAEAKTVDWILKTAGGYRS